MCPQIILTAEGKEKLEKELRDLKEVVRPEITAKIEQAKEMGDLSENAEYHEAKDQQGMVEARVVEIEEILRKAVMAGANENINAIGMGTKFLIKDGSGNEKELTMVGFNEAAPSQGKISNDSPMGRAFWGRGAGDSVEVAAPKGKVIYKIVKIL